jgi:L-threonylcarbamoyladenylate synthase
VIPQVKTTITVRTVPVDTVSPQADRVEQAADILRHSGVIVAPTETRYGLLALAGDISAVERAYRLKGRPAQMPTAVFVRHLAEAKELATFSVLADRLSAAFWPGPLTLVMPARTTMRPPVVQNGKIGLRFSSAPLIRQLVAAVGGPLTATSANRTGEGEADTVEQIARSFGGGVDMYLDGGRLVGPVSTVVECVGESWSILRQGPVTEAMIQTALARARVR